MDCVAFVLLGIMVSVVFGFIVGGGWCLIQGYDIGPEMLYDDMMKGFAPVFLLSCLAWIVAAWWLWNLGWLTWRRPW